MLTSSCSSHRSRLSNWHTSITVSVILSLPSLFLTLKIFLVSRSSIRGVVFFYLIYCHPSLMPPSIASVYHTILITLIFSVSEVIPSYSYCAEKGLVCIIIISLFSYQPLSYTECIKSNMHAFYNICSVLSAKYIYYSTLFNCLVLYLSCYRVLDLICC